MQKEVTILHLEDDPLDAELIRETLVSQGFNADVIPVETEDEFRRSLRNMSVELVLADYALPAFDGMTALRIAHVMRPELPFIFVSGTIGEEIAIQSLKSGAADYVLKQRLQRLGLSVHGALSDAAERRRRSESDKALRQSEERHRLFFESSPLPMWVYDVETLKFLAVNEAAIQHYGYSREEFLARTIEDIRPAAEVDRLLEYIAEGKAPCDMSAAWKHLKGNGAVIDVEITSHRIDYFGRPADVVLAYDVTERRRAEPQRTSELRYRRLFESAKDGILILDAETGQIVDVNPYLLEILDLPREQFIGKKLWKIGFFQDQAVAKKAFTELKKEGYIRYEDLPLRARNGSLKQVEFVGNRYLVGESLVAQCNIRDISHRKQSEAALKKANQDLKLALKELQTKREELTSTTQQLWQASKLATMGELAASIAHELNNPLATVALRAESVLEQLTPGDPKFRAVQIIGQEVERMARLVSNLLQFSRRNHFQITTLDLREELLNTMEFIEHYLRSHHVEIVHYFAAGLPTVQADRQELRQVFLNLITNASDAMTQGGTLTVRAFPGVLSAGGTAAVVEFADTGTGIQAGDLPKLWEPFFTTKPEGKGTGLGLAICRRAIEAHRGTIEIKTSPGQGTTVRIALPATDEGVSIAA